MTGKIHKDFHGALSVGFQHLSDKYGRKELEEYLKICGDNMYRQLAEDIIKEGLSAMEKYWHDIFSLEEGAFKITRKGDKEIKIVVTECPALTHMNKAGYPVYSDFCPQCRIINDVIAWKTGFISEVKSAQGKASCTQAFKRQTK